MGFASNPAVPASENVDGKKSGTRRSAVECGCRRAMRLPWMFLTDRPRTTRKIVNVNQSSRSNLNRESCVRATFGRRWHNGQGRLHAQNPTLFDCRLLLRVDAGVVEGQGRRLAGEPIRSGRGQYIRVSR